MTLNELLKSMVAQKASDLHLKSMRPPLVRIEGKIQTMEGPQVPPEEVQRLLSEVLTAKQKAHLEEHLYVDFGYSLPGVSRFRATIYYQRGTISAVFRRIPFLFPTIDDWGLPEVLYDFGRLPQGLMLVTGPTGSGKSSTLAALIKFISDTRPVHIVTIEDPIEFLFRDSVGVISQREVGDDTHSFHAALRNTMRQDPDVIMVGEMRDAETIMTAMTAAETGHLVFSTLHTNSAAQSIDRIIDSFPEGQHRQVRIQLSQVLKGIVSLKLVPRCDQPGLIAAVEILRDNPRIQKLILEGSIADIEEEMDKSVAYFKMQTMNQSLISLVLNRTITKETALSVSTNPADLDLELRKYLYGSAARKVEGDGEEAPDISLHDFMEMDGGAAPGEDMAETLSDFSKIVELQEIKKLYEESRSKHMQQLQEKDEQIHAIRDDLRMRVEELGTLKVQIQGLVQEREKIKQQLAFTKSDLEGKIQRLQERIQQLSAPQVVAQATPQPQDKNKGFFRK